MTQPQDRPAIERVVVLIPTYNEKDNVRSIVARTRAALPSADVMVLDDNSPDGTGAIADELARADPQVLVRHRAAKEGLGKAYLDGFAWALANGYDVAVEMDADGSHQPEALPSLMHALESADVVIGARWVKGGSVVNWPAHRKVLSVGANLYAKVMLGMKVNDATAGFRAYRRHVLETLDLHDVASAGYGFQIDLTLRAVRRGFTVVEVPITFVEREVGVSKMGQDIVVEAFLNVTKWGISHRAGQLKALTAKRKRPQRD